jgi:hypothetical protein
MKKCNQCGKILPLELFYKKLNGKSNYCISCTKQNQKILSKKLYDSNPEHRQKKTDSKIYKKWGMTAQEYEWKLESQCHQCAICDDDLIRGRTTHLDHCHNTGKIRDFLCQNCNRGIGMFRDNPTLLTSAINYLKRHNESSN